MRPLRVLVVDDEESIRYSVGEYLRRRGEECQTAESGEQALEYLRGEDYDVMLTDLMMPGLSGMDVVREAKRLRPQLVCIILTGHGSREDAIEAVREGVFEFIEKPVMQLSVLGMAVDRAGGRARLLRERDRLMADLQRKNARLEVSLAQLNDVYNRVLRQEEILEADLHQAQRMQKRLLPSSFPAVAGFEFFGYFCPCERLGGDFFGIIPLSDDRLAVYLADVAGHGVGASMVTVILRELIHAHRLLHPESDVFDHPAKALAFINQGLCEEDFDPPVLVTMVYAVVDGHSGELICACGGHPPPMVCDAQGRARTLQAQGPVLGIFGVLADGGDLDDDFAGSNRFQIDRLTLRPGDSVLLYSDGLPEARDGGGDDLGSARLAEMLAQTHGLSAADVAEEIENGLFRFVGTSPRSDDMTFLTVSRTEATVATGSHPRPSIKIVRPDEFHVASPRAEGRIAAGWAGNLCVIRLTGKVTWQQGHALRQTFRHALERPAEAIHIDVSHCQALDSTAIGILFEHADYAVFHGMGGRIAEVLHELGVLPRFRVSEAPPPDAVLTHIDPAQISRALVSDMILHAHETLLQVSDANRDRFAPVVEALRKSRPKETTEGGG